MTGIVLGTAAGGLTWSGAEHSTLVLGPSRSGKTSSFVIPNVLAAQGAVLTTSTKPDVLRRTAPSRGQSGWCLLFDPSGTVSPPTGVHRVGWSPVAAATSWSGAHAIADVMVRTARGRSGAAHLSGPEAHWTERSAALLGPLLHAAALDGAPMRQVLHWIDRHHGAPALEVLAARCGEDAVPTDVLAGILSTDARELSGIWSTASGVVAAYRSPRALASTEPPLLDADAFCAGPHTLYVCAPGVDQQLLAPLVVGAMSQVRDAAYRRAATSGPNPPVLFALDEVANIAPLPDLPAMVTEGPGQGLVTLACLQDLSQARARWGPEADAFLSIFGSSAVLPGIADIPTLEAIATLGGEREVVSRSVASTAGTRRPHLTTTDAAALRPRVPPDVIARGAKGWALALDARNRLGWVQLMPSHAVAPWRGLSARAAPHAGVLRHDHRTAGRTDQPTVRRRPRARGLDGRDR